MYGRKFSAAGNSWPHLSDIELPDPEFFGSGSIELILGADTFSLLVLEGVRKGGPGEPIALKTLLRWIVSGETGKGNSSSSVRALQCSVDEELSVAVRRFWEQEEVLHDSPARSRDDEKCLLHFAETHSRRDDGRYVVRLPFATVPPDLSDTRQAALRTLLGAERRFYRDEAFRRLYERFMREYLELGHMTTVATIEGGAASGLRFLPHHGVFREASSSTKLRVVFNSSLRAHDGR